MDDKIRINLQMADANYPITISRKDEEMVRKAAKLVDSTLNMYRERYHNLAMEKIVVMAAYQFALENLQLKQRNDTAPYTEKLKELTAELENYFRNE